MGERVVGRGTIGGLIDPLVEGTEETRRAAHEKRLRALRVAAARANRGWVEIRSEHVERRRRFVVNGLTGRVYEPLHAPVWAGGDPSHELNAYAVAAFYVKDGDVVCLQASTFANTAEELDWWDKDQAEQAEKRAQAAAAKQERHEQELRKYRDAQARRRLTLANVEGRALPTVADAAGVILGNGGTLAVHGGRLAVEVPERFAPADGEHEQIRARVLDATRVLVACSEVVIPAVESGSSKPLTERLPRVQAGAGGGLADA